MFFSFKDRKVSLLTECLQSWLLGSQVQQNCMPLLTPYVWPSVQLLSFACLTSFPTDFIAVLLACDI